MKDKEGFNFLVKGRVTEKQYSKIEKHCAELGITISDWIRQKIDSMRVKK